MKFATVTATAFACLLSDTVTAITTQKHINGFNFVSCYNDTVGNRILNGAKDVGAHNNSGSTCSKFCQGSTYFGLEYGTECYCGDTLDHNPVMVDNSHCNYTCSGNAARACGGFDFISVYKKKAKSKRSPVDLDEDIEEAEIDA